MTSQGEETDEEYLDDPITLIDFEQARVLAAPYQKSENKFQHDGYDPADSDGDVLIEKETLPSLGRFAVTLPVTFFDYPRNVSLLNRCKPFLIKVVDIKKHQWYYEQQNQILGSKKIIKSYTEVQRKESTLDVDIEKVPFNMHSEALKPKIRPVDISAYAVYNKVIKRNSSSELIHHVKENEKQSHLPRPVEYIDFKKNVGLVGLKISHTVDSNISNAEATNARPKDKKEVQANVAICGDSAKLQTISSSDKPKTCSKVENTTKRLLTTDQDNMNLGSKNKDPSDGSVNVKKPTISLNNKVNKELNEKVETANDLEKRTFFMNEYFNPNKGKHKKIEKIAANLMLKETLTTSTSSISHSGKNKCLIGRHIKFDPGILATERELDKKEKLPFGSQKISTKVAECIDITASKNNPKNLILTEDGKTEVSSGSKKGKKKAENEKKDDENGINVALYNNNVLKMVISKKSTTSLNVNQNSYTVRDGKKLTNEEQTNKIPDITQDVTYYLKPHDAYANVPIRKSLPNNGLLTDNNGLNYYQISSKNYSTIANPSTSSQVSQNNFRISAVESNQLSSICADNSGHLNNISAPITKTDKPEFHVISGPPSEITMRINSNNGKSAVSVQNITAMNNSAIQRTSLPKVTAKHSNLPGIIVQKKVCSPNTNENISQNAYDTFISGKSTEIKESRNILTVSDDTTNKQANLKEPAARVCEMFDAKGNVMNNQEIYVKRTVIKSNVTNNTEESSKAINQGLTQVAQEKRNTSDIFVINHQSSSSPINHGETRKIIARRTFPKSNIPEEKSRIIVDQVSTQVVQHRNNTSECVVTNHQLNPGLISHSESKEIIARRPSDSKYCINVGNNNIFHKTNSDGYISGPNSVSLRAALALHWNGTRVPYQGYQGESHGANSNPKGNLSFAQEKSNLQQRYSMAYTNNMRNFQSNMNMNQVFTGGNEGLNVNVPHNEKAVSTCQPMPKEHIGYLYQGQPIRSYVGNRPTQGQNRRTRMQKNVMNMISVDAGLPYHHMMQSEVPMNNTHCAPFYSNIYQDMNQPIEASYYNPNQSNALWSYLHPPAPPPAPVQTTGTFFPPTRTVNAPPQSAFVPSSVANNSSIIGCNNSGIIRKINIAAVPLTDKDKPSNTSSVFTYPVDNLDDKPANSKLEMLEELTKVIMDIPPDSPVKEKNLSYSPLKPSKGVFSQPSEPSLSHNTQGRSIPTTVQEGALSPTNGVRTASGQNVPTLTLSEHNIPSMTQARSNDQSSKLSMRDSPIRSPPKQTTASSQKNMIECPSTEASTEKHNKTFAVSSSPKIQNSKRPHPTTEASYPEMRKILSSNPKARPGPLSKKPKLHLFEKPPNRDPRGKLVLPAANLGYSPPILPILTYEKTLEHIAQAHPETKNVKEKDEFAPNVDKLPVSSLRSSNSKNNCSKRKLCDEDKQTTQDKLVKKISLDEYKKRVGINSEKDHSVNNIPIKMESKTEKFDDTKQCSDLDLGYDSDSTMIL